MNQIIKILKKTSLLMAFYVGAASAATLGYITGDALMSEAAGSAMEAMGLGEADSSLAGAYEGYSTFSSWWQRNHETPSTDRTLVNSYGKLTPKRLKLRKMSKQVSPQMDHLPGGISARTVKVRLGGTPKYKSSGNMSYMTQMGQSVSNGDTSTGALSGNQAIQIVGGFGTIYEFTRKTAVASDGNVAIGKNIFNFNPDQLTTGSGYTTGIAGVDSVTNATNTAGVPLQDFINWKNTRLIYDITNMVNTPCFGTFYVLKAKRDLNTTEDPITSWDYGSMNFKSAAGPVILPDENLLGTGEYYPSRSVVHTVPSSSVRFNNCWQILKVVPCNIAAGGNCKLKFDFEVWRTYDRQIMEQKLAQTATFYPKGCIQIMYVGHGAPIYSNSTVTQAQGMKYSLCNIGFVYTRKDNYGFVDRQKHWKTAMQWSTQAKQIPLDKQLFVGPADLGPIQVEDINV